MNKERIILLVCTVIGLVVGILIGKKVNYGEVDFFSIWFGIGGGVALSFLPETPGIFMLGWEEDGFIEAIKSTFIGGIIWLAIFAIAGPIGLIIRFVRTRDL